MSESVSEPTRRDVESRFDAAFTELRRERRRTADEAQALESFEDRVRSIQVETRPVVLDSPQSAVGAAAEQNNLEAVRNAYETTVMQAPHYEEEYGDGYAASLREEFNDHVAAALIEGTAFTERCKEAVLSAVSESQSRRESFLGVIDTERDSLQDATETVVTVAAELEGLSAVSLEGESFGALDAYRARLFVLEAKCESVSDRRQSGLIDQRRRQRLPAEAPDIAQYFYTDLAVDYPVMSAIAELHMRIDELRARIERGMTFCPT